MVPLSPSYAVKKIRKFKTDSHNAQSLVSKSTLAAFLVVISIVVPTSEGSTSTTGSTENIYLHCVGKYSNLDYEDCQGQYFYNRVACYHNTITDKSTPCDEYCNNKLVHSEDADKCRSYCPDYYQTYCTFQPNGTTLASPQPKGFTLSSWMMGLIAVGCVTVVAVAVAVGLFLKRHHRTGKRDKLSGVEDHNPHTPHPPRQRTDSESQPLLQDGPGQRYRSVRTGSLQCQPIVHPNSGMSSNYQDQSSQMGDQREFGSDRGYSSASGSNSCANSLTSTEGIDANQPDHTTAATPSQVPNMRSDQTAIGSLLPDAAPTSSPGIPQTSHEGPDVLLSSGTTNDGKKNLRVNVVNEPA